MIVFLDLEVKKSFIFRVHVVEENDTLMGGVLLKRCATMPVLIILYHMSVDV